jgi:hypothetical protein
MQLMDEINYRVVRGLLSANAGTQVQQVDINLDELEPKTENTKSSHPLFRQQGENEEGIKVIRLK